MQFRLGNQNGMTQISALMLIVVMSMSGVAVLAGGAGQTPVLATLSGTATSSTKEPLGHVLVRLRSIHTGNVMAATSSDAAGRFSFAGLNPDTYVIELVSAAGQIVGTSAAISVSGGAVVTGVMVSSSVAAAAAAGSASLLTTLGIVTAAAASAAIAGVTVPATTFEASPSK
jgi:carboxypeptidase family protein